MKVNRAIAPVLGLVLIGALPVRAQLGRAGGAPVTRAVVSPAFSKGIGLISAGKHREAVVHFTHLTEQYPTLAEAQVGLGFAQERLGRNDLAREAYERALKLDAREVRAMNNLAFLLIEGELDIPRAKKLLARAVQLVPDFASAWDNLGWAHYATKDHGRATEYFKTSLAKDPKHAPAHYHLGLSFLRREDYAAARRHFERVVKLDPTSVKGWISLGLCLQRMDRKSEALEAYNQALSRTNRKSAVGREIVRLINSLGSLYGSGSLLDSPGSLFGRYTPPTQDWRPFSNMDPMRPPTGEAPVGVGAGPAPVDARPPRRIVLPGGDPAASQAAPGPVGLPVRSAPAPVSAPEPVRAAVAVPVDPTPAPIAAAETLVKQDLVETHLRVARLYEQYGLFKDAVSEGQTVVNLAPWSKEATEARELVTRLEKKEDADVHHRIYGLFKLGQLFFSERQIEPAILQYEKVLVLNPGHPIAYKNLAFLNLKAGKLDVAYEQARRALEIESGFPEAMMIKGHIEARMRRFRDAYDTFRRLMETSREGTPIHQYASGLSRKMRRFIDLE
ncbi:MAG: tetratricopeptide repeat protein [Candidatus Riflebacteria bacterium]|nr:tetratricopeptide repeat protein [Candidatus Riflebacteria bacterium]